MMSSSAGKGVLQKLVVLATCVGIVGGGCSSKEQRPSASKCREALEHMLALELASAGTDSRREAIAREQADLSSAPSPRVLECQEKFSDSTIRCILDATSAEFGELGVCFLSQKERKKLRLD